MRDKIIVFGLVLVFLLSATVCTASALSNSGGGEWSSYDEITIRENSGETLTDYQVLVEPSGGDFPTEAQSDGDDIRFTDSSGTELSYWIEEWNVGSREAKIWVKVPSIPANGETKITMDYGNPSAGAVSKGDATYKFFDDFLGTSLNTNKWDSETTDGSISISDSKVRVHADSGARQGAEIFTKDTFSPPLILEVRKASKSTDSNGFMSVPCVFDDFNDIDQAFTDNYVTIYYQRDDLRLVNNKEGSTGYEETQVDGISGTTPRDLKLIWTSSKVEGYYDGNLIATHTDTTKIPTTSRKIGIKSASWEISAAISGDTWVDLLIVREYASVEPTVTISHPSPTTSPTPTAVTPTPTPVPTTTPTPVPTQIPAGRPQLTISQTTLKEEPEVGETVLITVTISNTGKGIAKNINLREHIPSSISVDFVDGANSAGNLITWGGELDFGGTHSITHSFKILEEKNRAVPVKVSYEDEDGKGYETQATIYITPEETPTPTPIIPGFEAVFAIAGLLVVVYLLRRRE